MDHLPPIMHHGHEADSPATKDGPPHQNCHLSSQLTTVMPNTASEPHDTGAGHTLPCAFHS